MFFDPIIRAATAYAVVTIHGVPSNVIVLFMLFLVIVVHISDEVDVLANKIFFSLSNNVWCCFCTDKV